MHSWSTVCSSGTAWLSKEELDLSGACAAVCVGFVSFAVSYRMGTILIVFYYTGSKITKVREDIKERLEADSQSCGAAECYASLGQLSHGHSCGSALFSSDRGGQVHGRVLVRAWYPNAHGSGGRNPGGQRSISETSSFVLVGHVRCPLCVCQWRYMG